MVQKKYRETRKRGIDKKKLKEGWKHRGTGKNARKKLIEILLKKAMIFKRKGKKEKAEELEEKARKIKGN